MTTCASVFSSPLEVFHSVNPAAIIASAYCFARTSGESVVLSTKWMSWSEGALQTSAPLGRASPRSFHALGRDASEGSIKVSSHVASCVQPASDSVRPKSESRLRRAIFMTVMEATRKRIVNVRAVSRGLHEGGGERLLGAVVEADREVAVGLHRLHLAAPELRVRHPIAGAKRRGWGRGRRRRR